MGLKNYAKVLADPKFVRSLWNTFYLIMVSFLAIPIGFVFAYIPVCGRTGQENSSMRVCLSLSDIHGGGGMYMENHL